MDEEKLLDKKTFKNGMETLILIYGDIDARALDIYYNFVKKWSDERYNKTVNNIIKYYDKNYFPKPAIFNEFKPTEGTL